MRVLPGIPVVLSHSVSVRCHTQSHGSTQRRNVLGTKFGCGRPVTCARNTDSSSRRDTTSHRRASHRVVRVSSAGSSEANARELGPPYQISEKTTLLADDSAGPEALVLSDGARQQLGGLTTSIFRYARSYQALFGYHVVNTGLQIWQVTVSPGVVRRSATHMPVRACWTVRSSLLRCFLCVFCSLIPTGIQPRTTAPDYRAGVFGSPELHCSC